MKTLSKRKKEISFNESDSGFNRKQAVDEARRFPLSQDSSCMPSCPLGVNITHFIRLLREGEVAASLKALLRENSLPAICGRICYAPCEKDFISKKQRTPVAIKSLERFAADHGRTKRFGQKANLPEGKKVAIVGSGPAGIAAAGRLTGKGFRVTVLDALPYAGGVLRSHIPEFRISRGTLRKEIDVLTRAGVNWRLNTVFGQAVTLDNLRSEGYEAVLLTGQSCRGHDKVFPGYQLRGVYNGSEILLRASLRHPSDIRKYFSNRLGNKIIVVGNNDMALDCARLMARSAKEVTMVFASTEEELLVASQDRRQAVEEGVTLQPLTKALEILPSDDQLVGGVKCIQMDYADPDNNGEWQLTPLPDSEFVVVADSVILCPPERKILPFGQQIADLKLNNKVPCADNETGMTSISGVFYPQYRVSGAGSIIDDMIAGKNVADQISQFLMSTAVEV